MRRFLTLFAALLLCALAHAASRKVVSFESDIHLKQDGSVLVLESYEFDSGSGSFVRRIVTDVPDTIGNRSYLIDVATVDDERGRDVAYYVRRSSDDLRIHVPQVVGHRLQIAYRVRNAVQFGGQNDELVWIANDPAHAVDVARFRVTLPDAAAGQLRAQTFLRNGGTSSRTSLWSFNGQVITNATGSVVESVAPGPLVAGVAAVTHLSLPAGILTPPGVFTRAEWFLRANPIVFLPLTVFVVMFIIWRIKRRAMDLGRSIAPLYEPPEGLTPAEVGTLIDDTVDPRDVTATLIDLAVRGYVRLEKTKPEHGTFGTREDYIVHLAKPRHEWEGLKAHEYTMLFHTFYGGQWTQLSSLRLRFPDIVPYIKVSLMTTLRQAGMYRVDPENALAWRQVITALSYVFMWGMAFVLHAGPLSLSGTATILSFIGSAVIVYLLSRRSSAKTLRGVKTYVAIRGFEEFLKAVEADRLKRLEPGIFEKYLPYAMALGVEHRWTRAFEGIAIKTPDWIETADEMFSSVAFGHHLDSMLTAGVLSVPRGRLPLPVAEAMMATAMMGKSTER